MNKLVQYELFSWTSSLLNYKELDLQLTQHLHVIRGEVSKDNWFCDIYASLLSGAKCSSVFITYCIYLYRTWKCMSSIYHPMQWKLLKEYIFPFKISYRSKCRQLEASPSPFCGYGWVARNLRRFNNLQSNHDLEAGYTQSLFNSNDETGNQHSTPPHNLPPPRQTLAPQAELNHLTTAFPCLCQQ